MDDIYGVHHGLTGKRALIYLGLVLLPGLSPSCSYKSFDHLSPEENIYHLTTVNDLENSAYTQEIEDFFDGGEEAYFKGANDISIYYKVFLQTEKEKGAIVISSGRTEAAVKYKELIFDLFRNGYSVYIHDHRGQGLSGRMTENPHMGYIDDFAFYVDDLKYLYDHVVAPHRHQPVYLLAHSMGGAIGMTYLEEHPEDFRAAAFSSPMLGLAFPSCEVVSLLEGSEIKYAPGQGNYEQGLSSFRKNDLTNCKIRYNRMIEAYEKHPQARLGGATYQWVDRSCQQIHHIFKNLSAIRTPLILFSAADDKIVSIAAHGHFVKEMNKAGRELEAFTVEDAQHELFIEKDEARIEVITRILNYFNDRRI